MAQPPPRRRDRGHRLDDYMAGSEPEPYGGYDYGYDSSPPRRRRHDSPPRRPRQARPLSPEFEQPPPRYESPPRRSKTVRDDHMAYGSGPHSPPRRRRDPSPPYDRDHRRGPPPGPRRTFPEDHDRAYGRGYDRGYDREHENPRGQRARYDEPETRPRRARYASPSPERRPRTGTAPPPAFHYDDSPPRRHRSVNAREPRYAAAPAAGVRAYSPPADRRRPPPATAGRPPAAEARGPRPRRNSMPTGGPPPTAKAAKAGWWTNPLIQASAKTAFTAGAQAAYSSRKDKGDWIGPKGLKVAQAALMGGVVDGYMGNRNKDSGRGSSRRSPSPPPRRSGGGGGGSNIKADLMNAGVQAALGKFANRR